MGLEILVKWAQETQNRECLKKIVRKDVKGIPFENDISVSLSLLKEIEKRAKLSEEHMAKAIKFERDISEYLEKLDKRGVKYPGIPAEVPIEPPFTKVIESGEEPPTEKIIQAIDNITGSEENGETVIDESGKDEKEK